MAELSCQKTFCQQDLFALIPELAKGETESFDAILSSFALHHLTWEHKDGVINQLFQLLRADGVVLLIDVIRNEKETRDSYIKRYLENVRRHWSVLTSQDYEMVEEHIASNDLPESQSAWWSLARKHGFKRMECLYKDLFNSTRFLVFYR